MGNERERQIEKIAEMVTGTSGETKKISIRVRDGKRLFKEASERVQEAAEKLASYRRQNAELQNEVVTLREENQQLVEKIASIEKQAQVNEILDMMVDKRMLKQTDVEAKNAELLAMNDETLMQFKIAVDGVQKSDVEKFGATSLEFLFPDSPSVDDYKDPNDMRTAFV